MIHPKRDFSRYLLRLGIVVCATFLVNGCNGPVTDGVAGPTKDDSGRPIDAALQANAPNEKDVADGLAGALDGGRMRVLEDGTEQRMIEKMVRGFHAGGQSYDSALRLIASDPRVTDNYSKEHDGEGGKRREINSPYIADTVELISFYWHRSSATPEGHGADAP